MPRASRTSRIARADLSSYSDAEATAVLLRYANIIDAEVRRAIGWGRRLGFERDDLETIARVAALEAHRSWQPDRGRSRPNWIGQVIKWRFADLGDMYLGRDSPSESLDQAEVIDVFGATARIPGPEEPFLDREREEAFENLVGRLSPRRRTIVACYLNGESFAQIGETLGVCLQFVHREYHAAVQQMKKVVEVDVEFWEG